MKMKKIIIIALMALSLSGCTEFWMVLEAIAPPDPACNQENLGLLWPERHAVCLKTVHGYQWVNIGAVK